MSDWDESSSSPEAGQGVFHEAITPVQSSPSSSERDEADFEGSTSHDKGPEVGLEREESSSGEDVPSATVESTTQMVDESRDPDREEQTGESPVNYEDVEDSAFNDEDRSGKDGSVERSDRHEEASLQEGSSDDEEKGEDSRQVLECGYRIRSCLITALS